MRVIGVYNIKGGVGKTAAAVNLAYLSAREGYRTLIWDLDPQAAATFYLRVKSEVKGGSREMIKRGNELDDHIKGSDFDTLDLLPADFSYRNMDLMLGEAKKPAKQLLRLLRPLSNSTTGSFSTVRRVSPWSPRTSSAPPTACSSPPSPPPSPCAPISSWSSFSTATG